MECISCGLPAGYNRLVIDLVTEERYGGFCRNCEFEVFGHTLSKFVSSDGTCVLCNRDGLYAIPAWEPYETTINHQTTCGVEYTVRDRTPSLCDEHFDDIRSDSDEPTAVQRGNSR